MTRVVLVGAGSVGARAAHELAAAPTDVTEVEVIDPDPDRRTGLARALGEAGRVGGSSYTGQACDLVLIAAPAGMHARIGAAALGSGAHVVSVGDSIAGVRSLLRLDAKARSVDRNVVVGAGFAPGLTCLLAKHGASGFDRVEEVHIAKAGTGGPECARQHHDALGRAAVDYRDGAFVRRRSRTGRELCWFPDPIGPRDCYRAALADALLLAPAFEGVERVTSRVAANRRNRLTGLFPMLRRPHADGGPGAVRVELRGRRGSSWDVAVYGVMDHPAGAAGAVAAVSALAVLDGRMGPPGAGGLATVADPLFLIAELHRRGVRAAVFEGVGMA